MSYQGPGVIPPSTPSAHPAIAGPPSSFKHPEPVQQSTCVEPDSRALIHSVSTVLHRRIRDNETADMKTTLPLFLEDTHTEPQ
eukprot:3072232-Prymnesium_polylepis.1